ncbi:unnamed protein product [Didymodactylos carnosus]|uniref:Pentapeptide repeat-containing protein n=1 Tax=Didymodactylos carnosus TaxID=1234261 RepID=A0A815YWQ8_9BILA|nr:unnamed protein product [Didymodactylos carnosus]CAF1575126.1 unnamed protein product [Didymodactylos carnosus]CAF4305452.1 unnamed protein product [Didymodactylos carnosus]CAF4439978.1 unnamed protein product [Didymodactylos carnosus]
MLRCDKQTSTADFQRKSQSYGLSNLTLARFLKIFSSALIPLMIGIFTIVQTLQQQTIADGTRSKDLEIATFQRQQDIDMAENLQNETIIINYIKEICQLLIENKNDTNNIIATVIRANTLIVLRRLDPKRKRLIIQFLYEAKLITKDNNPVDLSDAELNNVDFTNSIFNSIKLTGVYLINSTFVNTQLTNSDLSSSYLKQANFQYAKITDCNFNYTHLQQAQFSQSNIAYGSFYQSNLTLANFSSCEIFNSTFISADLNSSIFLSCGIDKVDFSSAQLLYTRALMSNIRSIKIDGSTLFQSTIFTQCELFDIDFSKAHFHETHFIQSKMKLINFSYVINAPNLSFKKCHLTRCKIHHATLSDADFSDSYMSDVDFRYANLSGSNFGYAVIDSEVDLRYATLTFTDFTNTSISNFAYFQYANLNGSNIKDNQLIHLLYKHQLRLPNGRIYNYLLNGDAENNGLCSYDNTTIVSIFGWKLLTGSITAIRYSATNGMFTPVQDTDNNCYFWAINSQEAQMMQIVDLENYDTHIYNQHIQLHMEVLIGRANNEDDKVVVIDIMLSNGTEYIQNLTICN